MTPERSDSGFLQALLVCPLCKSTLECSPSLLICTACGTRFPRTRTDCYELLAPHDDQPRWGQRQEMMERWYRDMIATSWAGTCFINDYAPLRPLLSSYRGTLLDLGGGIGLTRHYLAADVRYVSLDPSLIWLGPEWQKLAGDYPCLTEKPAFVQGTGEAMPFERHAFDAVLALWSLNHVSVPERVFEEVRRVLRPAGRFLVVLEDMEPRWRDVCAHAFRGDGMTDMVQSIAMKLRSVLPGGTWPIQPDHIRILESELQVWASAGLEVHCRAWVGKYLTYEFVRRAESEA
jgi:SAM-dependent methyltransferase